MLGPGPPLSRSGGGRPRAPPANRKTKSRDRPEERTRGDGCRPLRTPRLTASAYAVAVSGFAARDGRRGSCLPPGEQRPSLVGDRLLGPTWPPIRHSPGREPEDPLTSGFQCAVERNSYSWSYQFPSGHSTTPPERRRPRASGTPARGSGSTAGDLQRKGAVLEADRGQRGHDDGEPRRPRPGAGSNPTAPAPRAPRGPDRRGRRRAPARGSPGRARRRTGRGTGSTGVCVPRATTTPRTAIARKSAGSPSRSAPAAGSLRDRPTASAGGRRGETDEEQQRQRDDDPAGVSDPDAGRAPDPGKGRDPDGETRREQRTIEDARRAGGAAPRRSRAPVGILRRSAGARGPRPRARRP